MSTGKAALLAALEPATETVEIKGTKFIVSEIGATDYLNLWTNKENQLPDGEVDMAKFTPALIACSVVDESGQRVFDDSDIPLLRRAAYGPLMELAKVAKRLNGMAGEETKNSDASQTNSSCIDCACNSDTDTLMNLSDSSQPDNSTDGSPTQQ